jgi:hypothetical protein
MTEHELDTVYTALAESLGRVGEEKTPLLLSTLCLSLLARQTDLQTAMGLIAQGESLVAARPS